MEVKIPDIEAAPLISARGTCELLGGVSTVWLWRRQKDDPTFPRAIQFSPRGRRYWRRGEIEVWIEAHRVGAGQDD